MPKKVKPLEEVENNIQKPLDIAPPMPKGSQLKELADSPIKYDPAKTKEPKLPKKHQRLFKNQNHYNHLLSQNRTPFHLKSHT